METKNKKTAAERKGNKKSLTSAVRRVIRDRQVFDDFAMLAELYVTPLSC